MSLPVKSGCETVLVGGGVIVGVLDSLFDKVGRSELE